MKQREIFDIERIFYPRTYWVEMNLHELHEYQERIFAHYRKYGYPFQRCTPAQRAAQLSQLEKSSIDTAIDAEGNIALQMQGLGLCWSYHDHAIDVPCSGHKTVRQFFEDDASLRKTIAKCLKRSTSMSDNHFRETIRNIGGVQKPSNFRPLAAAAIYRRAAKMLNRHRMTVWDMCGGYGGRLLGAIASGVVGWYVCTEPCSKTAGGLRRMAYDIGADMRVTIMERCAEDMPSGPMFDLCFTSPPYYNTEVYSPEPTQSCNRYGTYPEWLRGFLRPVISKCADSLSYNGLLVLNVADTKQAKTLERDTIKAAESQGLVLFDAMKYLIGRISKGGMSHEPVFWFRRKLGETFAS
ncbi:MAG: hypothetical protein ABIH03_00515 [Pseudomonadota bacterium]